MKRLNKLYEANAIIHSAQSRIAFGLTSLKLNKADRETLYETVIKITRDMDRLSALVENLIVKETGLTETVKWANAAKNLNSSVDECDHNECDTTCTYEEVIRGAK